MKILIACEFSQIVTKAFREKGHEAYSCDLRDTEGNPKWHIKADFRSVRQDSWDFVGYHYTCRVMANSGVRWLYEKEGRWQELDEACEIFNLTLSDTRPGYSENPIPHIHTKKRILRNYDQIFQPYYFGDPYFKATCLWLRDIDPLTDTNRLIPPKKGTEEYKKWSMIHREPPGPEREKNRSRSFPGFAIAAANQWGHLNH
jgi:hypothetical protein